MNHIRRSRLAGNASTPEDTYWEIYAEGLPTTMTRSQLQEHHRWSVWTRDRWAAGRRPVTKAEATTRRIYSARNAGQ